MPLLTIKAPAKINLHLRVKNRRPDGYHSLESIFVALNFGDTLHFEPCSPEFNGEGGYFRADHWGGAPNSPLFFKMEAAASVFGAGVNPNQVLPLSENIIIRAVSLFNERTGFNMGLKIRLEKRMPVGGGLGGGSSDAASTLLALNFLATEASIPGIRPLNATAIGELGALLGSDVPFFLKKCGAARVSGRGERIKPLTIPSNLWIVLVKPDFSSDTAEAYRLLDQFRMAQGALYGLNDEKPVQVMPNAGAALALHPGEWPFINDFLPVFLAHDAVNTAYRRIFEQLQALGADFYSLSGAGSTCFGVFADKEKAYTAYENLRLQWNFVQCTFSLAI